MEPTPATTVIGSDGSPPGHLEKMLAMGGDAPPAPAVEPTVTPRPENVPEKFWDAVKGEINVEALLKSQADAEAALRRGQAPPADVPAVPPAVPPVVDPAAPPPVTHQQTPVVANASAEYAEKGELSAETYAALDKVGLPKTMVDGYIAGQQAIVGQLQTAAWTPFDGQEGYEAAANWAAQNLTDAEITALDVQLTNSNPDIVAQGAKALAARFAKDGDREPTTIRGEANSGAQGGVYTSSRDMMKDMSSAKYRTSETFRQEVARKLSRSSL